MSDDEEKEERTKSFLQGLKRRAGLNESGFWGAAALDKAPAAGP
jgi:hypothetical protein